MSIGIYADHHVHGDIIRGLRLREIDCLTVDEDGRRETADDLLLERARDLGRVMFSMDEDLLAVAAEWLSTGRDFAGLIYARQLGVTIGQAVIDVEFICKAATPAELASQVIYLPY